MKGLLQSNVSTISLIELIRAMFLLVSDGPRLMTGLSNSIMDGPWLGAGRSTTWEVSASLIIRFLEI